MKEIKYFSHFFRNIYLFFLFIFSVSLINKLPLSTYSIILGLITYFISYIPIYFINDCSDHIEDRKYNKANLYDKIINKKIFWGVASFITILGVIFAIKISISALFLLILLYLFNLFYSLRPFRLRNKPVIRELTIFIIYALKMLYLSVLLYSSFTALPIIIIIMSASTGAMSVSLYKRHSGRIKISELLFGVLFIISWILTELLYKQTFWLFFPLLPALLFLAIKYKKEQIPIGIYQTLYFFYTLFVYFFVKI